MTTPPTRFSRYKIPHRPAPHSAKRKTNPEGIRRHDHPEKKLRKALDTPEAVWYHVARCARPEGFGGDLRKISGKAEKAIDTVWPEWYTIFCARGIIPRENLDN